MHVRSRCLVSLWAAGGLLQHASAKSFSSAVQKADLFDWEKVQLTEDDLQSLGRGHNQLFKFYKEMTEKPSQAECKVFPGDPDWPEQEIWDTVNFLMDGQLLHPRPEASVCYEGSSFNSTACDLKTANWTNSYER